MVLYEALLSLYFTKYITTLIFYEITDTYTPDLKEKRNSSLKTTEKDIIYI